MSLTIDETGAQVQEGVDLARLLEEALGLAPVEATSDAEPTVRAIVLYNPLDPADREIVDLVWAEGKTLDAYLDGLPDDVDWSVVIGHREIAREQWSHIELSPSDTVIVGLTPNKSALSLVMIVAMVAFMVVAPEIGIPVGSFAFAAIQLGIAVGGYLITSMLADTSSTNDTTSASTSSYGIDGAKNTATESGVVPVVYGTMRIGGNKANVYVENIDPLHQILYSQFIIGEGPIEDVSAPMLNEQDISNFQLAFVDWRRGDQDQPIMPWFAESILPFNVQAKMTTSHYVYQTTDQVDRLRVDLSFPNGNYNVDSTSGKLTSNTTNLNATYRLINADNSLGEPVTINGSSGWHRIDAGNDRTEVACSGLRLTIEVIGDAGVATTAYDVLAEFAPISASDTTTSYTGNSPYVWAAGDGGGQASMQNGWNPMGSESGTVNNIQTIQSDGSTIYAAGRKLIVFEVSGFASQEVQFRLTSARGFLVAVEALYADVLSYTTADREALRYSFTTPVLPRGRYQLDLWRNELESSTTSKVDSLVVVDINEITDDLIQYANTAFYGLQVALGADLNSEPSVSVLVKGKRVAIYDRNGNVANTQWSDNPADVALDVMLNPRHRFAFSTTRIDFPAFDNWRNYCAEKSLKFNGVFDTQTNVWDALMSIMRVGRASPVLQGLKWSVLIEAPADPVMMFTQDHIIQGSFTTNWTGRKNRANMIEVQYFDQTDSYKQHSVFALDETYIAQGEALVQSTITLTGVTDATQASKEATLQLNLNRYLVQSAQFDVWIQAMGCIVGDVVLVQHDMPQWGYAARVLNVPAANTVDIDSDIPFNGETDWNLLLVRGIAQLFQGQVTALSGKTIQVGNFQLAATTPQEADLIAYSGEDASIISPMNVGTFGTIAAALQSVGLDRVLVAGHDYRVTDWSILGDQVIVTSDEVFTAPPAALVEFYKNDLMCEGPLLPPPAGSKHLVVATWKNGLVGNPRPGDTVMLGRTGKFKKPFRITQISYKDDHTRTISALEYNDSVYGDNAQPTPNYSALTTTPYQVANLTATQISQQLQGGAIQYWANFSWDRPLNDPRGYAGARVYVSLNHSALAFYQDCPNPLQATLVPAQLNDTVMVKVVAYERTTEVADYNSAPIAAITIGAYAEKPALVTGFTAVGQTRQIGLRWNIINDDYVKATEIWENTSNDLATAALLWRGNQNFFVHTGLNPQQTVWYWARTLSISNAPGDFVGPISATTTQLIADDIQNGILDTSKFANSIDFVSLVDGVPTSLSQTGGSKIAFDTQTGDLYRWNGTAFTKAIAPADVPGVALSSDVQAINTALTTNYLTASQTNAAIAAMQAGALTQDQIDQIKAATQSGLLTDAQIYASNVVGLIGDAQIQTINAAKINGQIVTTQIANNAITTPLIGANQIVAAAIASNQILAQHINSGSVTTGKLAAGAVVAGNIATDAVTAGTVSAGAISAREIAAGAITSAKLAVGSPTNMISNHSFIFDASDWQFGINGAGSLSGFGAVAGTGFDPTWKLLGSGTGFFATLALSLNQAMFAFTSPNQQLGIPAQSGNWYVGQAQIMPHRCAARVTIQFVNSAGTILAEPASSRIAFSVPADGKTLANYQKAWVSAQAPANAAYARLVVYGFNDGGSDLGGSSTTPFVFFTQNSLGQSASQATEAPVWDAGGVTTIGSGVIQSNAIYARNIAAGQISTTHLAVGSGNIISNACCTRSTKGWNVYTWGSAASLNAFTLAGDADTMGLPTYRLVGHGSGIATINNDSGIDGNGGLVGDWAPIDKNGNHDYNTMSVVPGNRYQAAVLVQAIRCAVRVDIIWHDAAGNYIAETDGTILASNDAGSGTNESQYGRATVLGTAPAGAATCYMRWITFGIGVVRPYVVFTKAMLSEAPPNAVVVGDWLPGGVTIIDGGVLQTNSIEADHLQVNSVNSDSLQANSVVFGKISAGAVHADQIAANQIRTTHLAADFALIQTAQIGDAIITTAKIQDLSVSNQKIQGGAVTSAAWSVWGGGPTQVGINVAVPPGGASTNGVMIVWDALASVDSAQGGFVTYTVQRSSDAVHWTTINNAGTYWQSGSNTFFDALPGGQMWFYQILAAVNVGNGSGGLVHLSILGVVLSR